MTKAYCINLDRRPDRLGHITAEFARHGLPFERIAAADAEDPAVAAAAAKLPPGASGRPISAGAYGCFLSHREMWRRLVASGDRFALVFEDDVRLAPGVAACLDPGWFPPQADIVRLETFGTRVHLDRRAIASVQGRDILRLRSTHLGTGSYAISIDCARRLLAESETFRDPIDNFLFDEDLPFLRRSMVFQMVPGPVAQAKRDHESDSDESGAPDWARPSILERHAGSAEEAEAPETPLARLLRRGRNEIRALVCGSRYVVVPFG